MKNEDRICLMHMLDAAQEAITFTKGKSRGSLDNDRMLMYSLIKSIEIIGEAATKVTDEFRETHNQIPWNNITGMRNRLIHAYFDINLDILWNTVNEDIPPLNCTAYKNCSIGSGNNYSGKPPLILR